MAVLDGSATLTPADVVTAFADPELWPPHGDWLIIDCHDDGSARFGIAPFPAAAMVINPEETCGAVSRELGR